MRQVIPCVANVPRLAGAFLLFSIFFSVLKGSYVLVCVVSLSGSCRVLVVSLSGLLSKVAFAVGVKA